MNKMMDVKSITPLNDEYFVNEEKIIEQSKRIANSDRYLSLKEIAALQNISQKFLQSILSKHEINLRALFPKTPTPTPTPSIYSPLEKKSNDNTKDESQMTAKSDDPHKPSCLKIITINIPDQYLDCIESMVKIGFFPSRSEAVREALKQFLTNEAELNKNLDSSEFSKLKQKQMESILQ